MSGLQAALMLGVTLLAVGCHAQFRIVGVLNESQLKASVNTTVATVHRTNAQGRGFSVVDGTKRTALRPNNIIRVHIIDDDADSVFPKDGALLKHKQKFHEPAASKLNKTGAIYHDRRTQLQRISVQLNKSRYQPKSSSVLPDNPHHSVASSNPVGLKHHKLAKYRNRYKSRCRCERIQNCPRIQIAVSRCQPNYFLCCF